MDAKTPRAKAGSRSETRSTSRSGSGSEGRASRKTGGRTPQPGLVEWVLAAVSAVLVLAMLGLLLYEAADQDIDFAVLETEQIHTERVGSRYLVRFRVRNRGDVTAATVLVEGTLERGAETVETSEATFDYVPSRSEREGALLFSNDPASHNLSLEAKGYNNP